MSAVLRNTILVGDAASVLAGLPESFVDCVISSPPFYQLRSYGIDGQIGLEPTVDAWVEAMRAVMRQVARVLKPTGSVWLDLADAYSRAARYGAPRKSLLLAPDRLMLVLLADGWSVRNKVIWAKTSPKPESVGDRLSVTYDTVYFLVRSTSYFFDLNAVRPRIQTPDGRTLLGKNPGDVWPLASRGFKGAHFATFPEQLVQRPLRATCPERLCVVCSRPWRRQVEVRRYPEPPRNVPRIDRYIRRHATRYEVTRTLGNWQPCGCNAPTRPGLVLDPFFGTGTVGVVAEREGRHWLGVELSPRYAQMAAARIEAARPPLLQAAA